MSTAKQNKIARLGKSVEDLFAYAEAMEAAAVKRYRSLAAMMQEHNNKELTELFTRLAEIEQLHVNNVCDYSRELGVPLDASTKYVGFGLDGEEVMGFEEVHYLHLPYHTVELAHRYEKLAADLYTEIAQTTTSDEVRKVAEHFANDELMHMKELERWLERYPKPEEGWDEDLDPPNEAE
jgi:rubrerythrin